MLEGVSGQQMIFALLIGIILLIFLILKTKVHPFLALIISAVTIGLLGGMKATDVTGAITAGFGSTLSSIGIIIGFGVMLGQIFEISGSAKRMAHTFLKLFGPKHEELALSLTGFIVSIAIFCDSGFIILSPLAKSISKRTKKSVVGLGVALASGLVITHSLVPPTPGPLAVAGTFGVDVGQFILIGLLISVPMALACLIYARHIGEKIYQLPAEDNESWVRPEFSKANIENIKLDEDTDKMPSTFASFFPLVLPILLILCNTVFSALNMKSGVFGVLIFLGTPVIAVGLGLIVAIYTLALKIPRETIISEMDKGIKSAGIIIFLTGGGGALGKVLSTSGVGNYIASGISSTAIPVILLPFLIATLLRFVQGSGTVAMITSASITAPIISAAGANMILGAFAACIGALFFSYFNDSFYWVVNNLLGIKDTKEQIRVWSVTTTIAWAVGLVEILVLSIFMH